MVVDDLTLEDLGKQMFVAAKDSIKTKSKIVKEYLKVESEKLAITLRMIIENYGKGIISKAEAKILFNQQKTASLAVLTAAEGMGIVTAQTAINSALKVGRDFVNSKIGFTLL